MKITGYVLFSVGIVFAVRMGLAAVGGADLPYLACSAPLMLIVGGWRMKDLRSSQQPTQPAAVSQGVTTQTAPAALGSSTIALPMIPR